MKEKRVWIAILAAAVIVAFAACCSGAAAWKAKGPALVRSVTEYGVDYEAKEWIPHTRTEYRYENGYPVSINTFSYEGGDDSCRIQSYTFESNRPVSMNQYDRGGNLLSRTEYAEGKVSAIYAKTADEGTTGTALYSYANGDAYFTLKLMTIQSIGVAGDYPGFSMEEVDSVSVSTRNGLLSKTVNTGLYANWNDGEEKEWMRFNGIYTANYDETGILHSTSGVFRAGPSGEEDRFEVTKEQGRVVEAVRFVLVPGQEPLPMAKIIFEYTDIGIDPVRYAAMINAHLLGDGNNYYQYFWY